MPGRKKNPLHVHRLGYKKEYPYPLKGGMLLPSHGDGPRCRVDHDPNDDGPWTMLQIMRIGESNDIDQYTCAMPRCYAIPLILVNKRLAFHEAQCRPDGTPFPLLPNNGRSGSGSSETGSSPERSRCAVDMREYSYLWRMRGCFLQAVYEMNHERRLDDRWRFEGMHGYLHRTYRRYGHDRAQRIAYWKEEIKGGRVPYAEPDIADMDWETYILEDMATDTGMDAYLWNRISQGYNRVVKDAHPQESWRAWCRGRRDPKLEVPCRSPAPTVVHELRSELCAATVPDPVLDPRRRRRRRDVGLFLFDEWRTASFEERSTAATAAAAAADADADAAAYETRVPAAAKADSAEAETQAEGVVPAAADAAGSVAPSAVEKRGAAAGAGRGADADVGESEVESATDLEYEDVLAAGPSRPRLRPRMVSVRFNAPDDMELTVIQCTLSRVEEVGRDFKTELKVVYDKPKRPSLNS
ncbi:hypothetical protein F5148DRAFT_1155838 [Russula earlei]|uniref:Uncharacterized protein n=1 Tax=Russula earlei TaxID=71964 RepID=A0ACC0UQU2_9AGAM|nr:hypothetical protein F5148DRAFT_1155838 [Russula earlei]